MKIFQINSFFSAGGPPRIIEGIYHNLLEHGDDFILAAGREQPIPGMPVFHIGGKFHKYWHWLGSYFFDAQGFCSGKATHALISKIKEYKPDIIHLHNLHGYYLQIEVLFDFLKSSGIPVVWTLHDCWAMSGHCAHWDYINCNRWEHECHDCPQERKYPICRGLDRSESNYRRKRNAFCGVPSLTLVTPSQWLVDLTKRSFLREYPANVIYNGIDLNEFKPTTGTLKEYLPDDGKRIVLGVAQVWSEHKGLSTFVRLAETLAESHRIILIGVTKKDRKHLPGSIVALPRTKNVQELAEYYSAADVFVNPTLEDTFPTTNLEAMACGTPVITYRSGGSPESLAEQTGVVIPRGDFETLVKAIRKTVKTPEVQAACIARGREFDRKEKFSEYIRLYERLTTRSGK